VSWCWWLGPLCGVLQWWVVLVAVRSKLESDSYLSGSDLCTSTSTSRCMRDTLRSVRWRVPGVFWHCSRPLQLVMTCIQQRIRLRFLSVVVLVVRVGQHVVGYLAQWCRVVYCTVVPYYNTTTYYYSTEDRILCTGGTVLVLYLLVWRSCDKLANSWPFPFG